MKTPNSIYLHSIQNFIEQMPEQQNSISAHHQPGQPLKVWKLVSFIFGILDNKPDQVIYLDREIQSGTCGIRRSNMTEFKRNLNCAQNCLTKASDILMEFKGRENDQIYLAAIFEKLKNVEIGMKNCLSRLLEIDLDQEIEIFRGTVFEGKQAAVTVRTELDKETAHSRLMKVGDLDDNFLILIFLRELEQVDVCLRDFQSYLLEIVVDQNAKIFKGIVVERKQTKTCELFVRRNALMTPADSGVRFSQNLTITRDRMLEIFPILQQLSVTARV